MPTPRSRSLVLLAGAIVLVVAAYGGSSDSEPASAPTSGGFDHIVDESGAIWANFEIVSQPSFIFLDASGDSTTHLGALGVDGISERLDTLIIN